jgi:hypothetical protein
LSALGTLFSRPPRAIRRSTPANGESEPNQEQDGRREHDVHGLQNAAAMPNFPCIAPRESDWNVRPKCDRVIDQMNVRADVTEQPRWQRREDIGRVKAVRCAAWCVESVGPAAYCPETARRLT